MEKFLAQRAVVTEDGDVNCDDSGNDVADAATQVVSKKRKMYKRLYDDKYLAAYGFTVINVAGEQRPQCVVCSVVLSNDAMKPAKLSHHFTSKHAEYKGKSDEYFNRLCRDLKQQKSCLSATVNVSANSGR